MKAADRVTLNQFFLKLTAGNYKRTKSFWRSCFFICVLNDGTFFKLICWTFHPVFLNIVKAVYFQLSPPGTVFTMASFSVVERQSICAGLRHCQFLFSFFCPVLFVGLLSDALVAIFTSSDKSIILASGRAWQQHLKMEKGKVRYRSSGDTFWN